MQSVRNACLFYFVSGIMQMFLQCLWLDDDEDGFAWSHRLSISIIDSISSLSFSLASLLYMRGVLSVRAPAVCCPTLVWGPD